MLLEQPHGLLMVRVAAQGRHVAPPSALRLPLGEREHVTAIDRPAGCALHRDEIVEPGEGDLRSGELEHKRTGRRCA